MPNEFMGWFNQNYPQFYNTFGKIEDFYDKDSDSFHIQEIDDAYLEFKSGVPLNSIMPMYFAWNKMLSS